MKSVIYEELVNDIRNIAACRDLSAGDVTKLSDAAWLIESLQSRIEALEKDAAQYRLASIQDNFCDFVIHAFGCYCDDKESADRVIDTAMQSEKGGV